MGSRYSRGLLAVAERSFTIRCMLDPGCWNGDHRAGWTGCRRTCPCTDHRATLRGTRPGGAGGRPDDDAESTPRGGSGGGLAPEGLATHCHRRAAAGGRSWPARPFGWTSAQKAGLDPCAASWSDSSVAAGSASCPTTGSPPVCDHSTVTRTGSHLADMLRRPPEGDPVQAADPGARAPDADIRTPCLWPHPRQHRRPP